MSKQAFKPIIISFDESKNPQKQMDKVIKKLSELGLDAEFGVANVIKGTNMAALECTSDVEDVIKQMKNVTRVSPNSMISLTPQPIINGDRIKPILPKNKR